MVPGDSMTLKEVQLRLGAPQHVLIHLCEKGVVEPDFADTDGRGKRREFSQRNLLEFALALALRQFELPVARAAFVVRLLRSFAHATKRLSPDFEFPAFLLEKGAEVRLFIDDGDHLLFRARGGALRRPLLLGAKVGHLARGVSARPRAERLDELPRNYVARLEIDLTKIAANVFK